MVGGAGRGNYTRSRRSMSSRHTGHDGLSTLPDGSNWGLQLGCVAHDPQSTTCPHGMHLWSLCESRQITHVFSSSGVVCEDVLEAARSTRATSHAHGPRWLLPTIKFTQAPAPEVGHEDGHDHETLLNAARHGWALTLLADHHHPPTPSKFSTPRRPGVPSIA